MLFANSIDKLHELVWLSISIFIISNNYLLWGRFSSSETLTECLIYKLWVLVVNLHAKYSRRTIKQATVDFSRRSTYCCDCCGWFKRIRNWFCIFDPVHIKTTFICRPTLWIWLELCVQCHLNAIVNYLIVLSARATNFMWFSIHGLKYPNEWILLSRN